MSLALFHAAPLKAEIRLEQAVSKFENSLDNQQKATFGNNWSAARTNPPALNDVVQVTAELDRQVYGRYQGSRPFGPRFTNILQSIQQYAALGDIMIGGSQNLIACGVWSAVRLILQLSVGHFAYFEKLSELFMEAGRQAPRHQVMATIYPKSKDLQRYLFEYHIVVVSICQHVLDFCRKPILGRMKSALFDSKLKEFHSELQRWSASISGQIQLLLHEGIMNENKQNSRTREFLTKWRSSDTHRNGLGNKVRWLDACSTYDYQTTWKQTRKKGTSSLLSTWTNYQSWKDDSASSTMLLSGKLGAGKSVTMANIVDDLSLQKDVLVFYFFCRHDLPESLRSRTIIGSLARQYLSQLSVGSKVFADDVPLLDTLAMADLIVASSTAGRTYLLIDGLDECPTEEQHSVLQCLAQFQHMENWHLGISARLSAGNVFGNEIKFTWSVSMPIENPDIASYVKSELIRRQTAGELVTNDDQLIADISEALLSGYNGMFLWVSLQIDAVCSESSDHDIRETLQNPPEDLNETYARILRNSARLDHRQHHIRLFKFIVAAFEPLNLRQITEVMSVTVGNTSWDPKKLINNIMIILKFCGSLIMIDEEEHTVRFVHHTARDFCLGSSGGSICEALPFTEIEAHQALGEATLTYLNYGIFDSQLSTRVIPNIDARQIPGQIAHQIIGNSRLLANVFKKTPEVPRDIGQVLTNLGGRTTGNQSQSQHPFYAYAQQFWILQSRHITRSQMRSLWDRLMQNSDAPNVQISSFASHFEGLLDISQAERSTSDVPGVIWALNYSHFFLFEHFMTRSHNNLSVHSLVRQLNLLRTYLKLLSAQSVGFIKSNMASEMMWRLLTVSMELGVYGAARRIIRLFSTNALVLSEEYTGRPLSLRHWSEDNRVQKVLSDLAQNVALSKDVHMLRFLLREGLSSADDKVRMIEGFLRSKVPQEVFLRACFAFARASPYIRSADFDVGYAVCHHLTTSAVVGSIRVSESLKKMLSNADPSLSSRIFRQACESGNFRLASLLWPSDLGLTFQGDEIELVLRTLSRDRSRLARKLLGDDEFTERLDHGPAVKRAVVLKQWGLARRLMEQGADPKPLIDFCNANETLHHCVLTADSEGLDFLYRIVRMDINKVSDGPTFSGYAPAELLAPTSTWRHYPSLGSLLIQGVEPRCSPSGDPDPTVDEQDLMENLEVSSSAGSAVIRMLRFDGLCKSSWVGKLAFVTAASMMKVVRPCFEPDPKATQQEPQKIMDCFQHLSELAIHMGDVFRRTAPSAFNYCEILWSLDEVIGTIQFLDQPPEGHGQNSLAKVAASTPDPTRFMVQTMLFRIVYIILLNTVGRENNPSELDSMWDEFCATWSRRCTFLRTLDAEAKVEFHRDLRVAFDEGSFPWMAQCTLHLRKAYSSSTLARVMIDFEEAWPNFPAINPDARLWRERGNLDKTTRILWVLCDNRITPAEFLCKLFSSYLWS